MDANNYEKALVLYHKGRVAFENNDIEIAICYFLQSAQQDVHFKTYEWLYTCYIKLGDDELAFEAIQKAYELNPQNDKTAYIYACMLKSRGDVVLSQNVAREILRRNPSYRPKEIQKILS